MILGWMNTYTVGICVFLFFCAFIYTPHYFHNCYKYIYYFLIIIVCFDYCYLYCNPLYQCIPFVSFFVIFYVSWKNKKKNRMQWIRWFTYLGIPILIKVIYACDASPIAIWVVHMTHISSAFRRITRHHSLSTKQRK